MPNSKEKWILVADSENARLLACATTAHGRAHFDEKAKLRTTFVPGEHQRPSQLARGHSSHASFSHEQEEKLAHFAREVSTWLGKELDGRKIAQCVVFAPARFLGALRKEVGKGLAGKLVEREGEITQLTAGQLAEHRSVLAELASLPD